MNFTADGIFTVLKDCLESHNIPFTNLLSFTSDTCNVMKGVGGGVIAKLKAVQPSIIDVHCVWCLPFVKFVCESSRENIAFKN